MTILGVGGGAGTINSFRYRYTGLLGMWTGGVGNVAGGGHAALIHYLLLFLPACMCFFCRAREF